MIPRHQIQLEPPACLNPFRCLALVQQISDELPLIRRRSFAAAEWAQKHKPVPSEHRPENLRDPV